MKLFLLFFSLSLQAQIPANLSLTTLFTANSPIAIRHAGDGSNRLFIVEQGGLIKIYDGSNVLATPFIDLTSKVLSGGELGLLGLDFDPNFSQNGYFYVNYTKKSPNSGDTIIERYTVSSNNSNIADFNSGIVIMRINQTASNHNGGDIHFGPDGFLYIGMGDGGGAGDVPNNAQNMGLLLGKMLRIDVSNIIYEDGFEVSSNTENKCGLDISAGAYKIPKDNPYVADAAICDEIWSLGLRNPWRWSFDRLTGDLMIGDVGQDLEEEINFAPANSTGGEHYGWNCREGSVAYPGGSAVCNNGDVYVEPVITHTQEEGFISIVGGYVYRGPIVGLQGLYIYTDVFDGDINMATPNGAGTIWTKTTWSNVGGIAAFGEDEQGNLYTANVFNGNVSVFELTQ